MANAKVNDIDFSSREVLCPAIILVPSVVLLKISSGRERDRPALNDCVDVVSDQLSCTTSVELLKLFVATVWLVIG